MLFRRALLCLSSAAALCALAPAAAHADFFASDQVDAGADLVSVGDLDIARDGTGAVAYLKNVAGVNHVYVSRLVDGVWQPAEQADAGLTAPGAQPVVAASDGGRLLVAFLSGGQLFTTLRPAGASGFTAPQLIATQASDPAADMSINGAAYVSFTTSGASAADVRVAHLRRDGQDLQLLPDTLDIDPGRDAGAGTGRSQVAISADGTAVVVWGEASRVFARRVFDERISAAPQDLTLDAFEGRAGGGADMPDIDIEDDSSYAWAVFRQRFDDGRLHTVTRRLVGSQFEAPQVIDGLGFGTSDDVSDVHIELSGRGVGIASTSSAGGGAFGALYHDDKPFPAVLANPGSAVAPRARGGIAETLDAFIAYRAGSSPADALVRMRAFDIDPAKRTVPGPGPEATIAKPELGPVDLNAGFDVGVNRAGDAVAVFLQGTGAERRLVSGGFDRAPGQFRTYTATKYRSLSKTPLSWGAAFDLWGPITYRVEVDGKVVAETTATKLATPPAIGDGQHTWRVVATDRRGQVASAPSRPLRVDGTPPTVSFTLSGTRRVGRTLTLKVRAGDPNGSGLARIRVDWGDGTKTQGLARQVKHTYRSNRTFTIRVSATDKAKNAVAATRRVKINKRK